MPVLASRKGLVAVAAVMVGMLGAVAAAQVVKWGRIEHSFLPGLGKTPTLFAADSFVSSDLVRMRLKGPVREVKAVLETPATGGQGWSPVGSSATLTFDDNALLISIATSDTSSAGNVRVDINNEFEGRGAERRVVKRMTESRYGGSAAGAGIGFDELTELSYDAGGQLSRVRSGSRGRLSSLVEFRRDSRGRPWSQTSTDASGEKRVERFDGEGRLIEMTVFSSPADSQGTLYRYVWLSPTEFVVSRGREVRERIASGVLDERGSLIRWTTSLEGPARTFRRTFTYDARGNWTSALLYEVKGGAETPVERWTRTITYAGGEVSRPAAAPTITTPAPAPSTRPAAPRSTTPDK